MASSYLSNALFLILASIGYREMRCHQLHPNLYPKSVQRLLLVALTTATYSFYPAFLPLLILALLLTQVSYWPSITEPWVCRLRQALLTLLVQGLTVLLLVVLTFTSQADLGEVGRSLSPMIDHAKNFVPINPWSLLQEKPKPMPNVRDFGWWFHLSLSLPLCILAGFLCWRLWRRWRQPDLLAGVMGIAVYGVYLLLFFPLEHTYRLMKLNSTLLYPLAIYGTLPLVFAVHRWTIKQVLLTRLVLSLLVVFHIVFHVKVVADLGTRPAGVGFARTTNLPSNSTAPIVVFGCSDASRNPAARFYERLVGLDLALRHPDRDIHVFSKPLLNVLPPSDGLTINGQNQYYASGYLYCQYPP
ncbi:MAG: hypothetical protein ERJ67_02095 [Aphanocapsa feldmannii 277cV]|uniref:Uncharacterized protein n=1 Tax=Aphanocapsa feldmannii 277cV TaxID=2507553 RepID=A0A524RQ74_9CHRO|nr:MAG: hypothetical protein ERJ67_02095 [Aphanocapsa feldmannii 277cV]